MTERHVGWITARPAPALRGMVDRYVEYDLRGFPPGIHYGVPSGRPTFIVSIGDAIDVVAQPDPTHAPARYGAVLSGLSASTAHIAHDGNQRGVTVELTPVGFRSLFGMPAGDLWNVSVSLDDVVGRLGAELWERVQTATTPAQRFSACDDVLAGFARDAEVVPELREAWRLVVGSRGTSTVAGMADAVGWSRQHLTKRFDAEFGLTPKLAARIVRFERAYQMLRSTPSFITTAQVAAVCGYYDQAHLHRDVVAFTGLAPTQVVVDELPSFQDEDAVPVAH